MKTLFLSQINTIKTFLVKISMCKILKIHIYVQQNWVTYVQNGGVHNIYCICAKCANKMDCLREICTKNMKNHEKLNSLRAICAKNMNNHEKLNSLRAPRKRAHCPRHCHCSCTNCCGCCSNAFDNINDMQTL